MMRSEQQCGVPFDFAQLFTALVRVPGLQRRDWERNQSGVDRGIEAVLIQRSPRELATYALVRLRLACMPHLEGLLRESSCSAVDADGLSSWAIEQGGAAKTLARTASDEGKPMGDYRCAAACAVLRYYRHREEPNALVQAPWTDGGFTNLTTLDVRALDEAPIRGAFWQAKLAKVQQIVRHVRRSAWDELPDDAVMRSLRSVAGEQTAAMVALFWLGRPVPIIDTYLERLLRQHGLLPHAFQLNANAKVQLAMQITRGTEAYAQHHEDWTPARILSCLYLWACEIGRLRCDCDGGLGPTCPLARLLTGQAE
jgi:endonuclease III